MIYVIFFGISISCVIAILSWDVYLVNVFLKKLNVTKIEEFNSIPSDLVNIKLEITHVDRRINHYIDKINAIEKSIDKMQIAIDKLIELYNTEISK